MSGRRVTAVLDVRLHRPQAIAVSAATRRRPAPLRDLPPTTIVAADHPARGSLGAGNWSSYPPHKHDEDLPGVETVLEEIYYYEVTRDGFGDQRVYGSCPGRETNITAEVRSGEAIVMPHDDHGPSMAA